MTGLLAVVASLAIDMPIRDPEGFLGPSWLRLPLLVGGAFLGDVVPRAAWRSRGTPHRFMEEARLIIRDHWTRERITLVVIGLASFYLTYVGYRSLKNFLPFIRDDISYDLMLRDLDQALFFGTNPATALHDLLGVGISAHALSFVYVLFLPFVPLSLIAWLVWSRNISFGYWYVTSLCLCWVFGTASYYSLPSQGPAFWSVWLFEDLPHTAVTSLQASLDYGRDDVLLSIPFTESVQSIAGFASLHVAITLCAALVAHYTVRHAWIRWSLWIFFATTVVSTIYFGWHYIADDVAGVAIAAVAVWLGGLATGQKFDKHGRSSHPTTTSANVPVEQKTV